MTQIRGDKKISETTQVDQPLSGAYAVNVLIPAADMNEPVDENKSKHITANQLYEDVINAVDTECDLGQIEQNRTNIQVVSAAVDVNSTNIQTISAAVSSGSGTGNVSASNTLTDSTILVGDGGYGVRSISGATFTNNGGLTITGTFNEPTSDWGNTYLNKYNQDTPDAITKNGFYYSDWAEYAVDWTSGADTYYGYHYGFRRLVYVPTSNTSSFANQYLTGAIIGAENDGSGTVGSLRGGSLYALNTAGAGNVPYVVGGDATTNINAKNGTTVGEAVAWQNFVYLNLSEAGTANITNTYGNYIRLNATADVNGEVINAPSIYGTYTWLDLNETNGGVINVNELYGHYIKQGTGTANNVNVMYGLYIEEPTWGNNNYAIWVAGGESVFFGKLTAATLLDIGSTHIEEVAGGVTIYSNTLTDERIEFDVGAKPHITIDDGVSYLDIGIWNEIEFYSNLPIIFTAREDSVLTLDSASGAPVLFVELFDPASLGIKMRAKTGQTGDFILIQDEFLASDIFKLEANGDMSTIGGVSMLGNVTTDNVIARSNRTFAVGFSEYGAPNTSQSSFVIYGEWADPDNTSNLNGGAVNIYGGDGAANSSGSAHGGDISIQGGEGYGTGNGGDILIQGGNVDGTGSKGNIFITGMTTIYSPNESSVGLIVEGAVSQTANLFEVNTNGNTGGDLFSVEADGETFVAGNLGVQVTTPNEALVVNGWIKTHNKSESYNGYIFTSDEGLTGALAAGQVASVFFFDENGNFGIRSDSAANILGKGGVGTEHLTITPAGLVKVNNNNLEVLDGDIWLFDTGGDPRIVIGDGADAGEYATIQWMSGADYLQIGTQTGGADTLIVNESKNVGIGEITIGAKLHVTSDTDTKIGQIIEAAASQTANLFEVNTNGSTGGDLARIAAGGQLITAGDIKSGNNLRVDPNQYLYFSAAAGTNIRGGTNYLSFQTIGNTFGNDNWVFSSNGNNTYSSGQNSMVSFTAQHTGSGTAATDGILLNLTGSLGDGTGGEGNNLIRLQYGGNTKFKVGTDGKVTLGGQLDTNEQTIKYNQSPTSDHTWNGDVINDTVGEDVARNDILYLKTDGKWWKADRNVEIQAASMLSMATAGISADASGDLLLRGFMRDDTFTYSTSAGRTLYLAASGGIPTENIPSATGDFLRVVGWNKSTTVVYFNPDSTYVEI